MESVALAEPVTTPVVRLGVPTDGVPATGVPGSTPTVMVWVVVRTPLLLVSVKVSMVFALAARRWVRVGVYVNAPVPALMLTAAPPALVVGAL
jgi:hypothetical protein